MRDMEMPKVLSYGIFSILASIIRDLMLLLVASCKNNPMNKSSFVVSVLQANPFTFMAVASWSTRHEKIHIEQEMWGGRGREKEQRRKNKERKKTELGIN